MQNRANKRTRAKTRGRTGRGAGTKTATEWRTRTEFKWGQQPIEAQNSGEVEKVDENPKKDEEDMNWKECKAEI